MILAAAIIASVAALLWMAIGVMLAVGLYKLGRVRR